MKIIYAAAAALLALSGQAIAVGTTPSCTKVEYANAKDWPLEKLIKEYCSDGKVANIDMQLGRDMVAAGPVSAKDSKEVSVEISNCLEQQTVLGRVIQNVHKQPLPSCEAKR